jgi:cytochrome c oxidase subunit 2
MSPAVQGVPQSVLEPASAAAQLIGELTIALFAGGVVVVLLVMLLLARGVRTAPTAVRARRWIILGGLALPGLTLAAVLVSGLRIGVALSHPPDSQGLDVEVIARRWWWELRYRDPQGVGQVVLANELHLPLGREAVLTILSNDVIHSFWVPALGGKVDAIPGQPNRLVVHPIRTGRYRGQCAEYCGTQHAGMGLEVVVENPAQFRTWLLAQARPAGPPADEPARRGAQVFLDSGCATCHAVRGTAAAGQLGPDLTHLASRRRLAAATLPNDAPSLQRWIRSAQHVKPGSLMPSLPAAHDEEDLLALAAYLQGLQ